VQTVAASGEGLEEVYAAVERHRAHLELTGEAQTQAESRLKDEAADLVGEWARAEARRLLDSEKALSQRLLEDGTPYAAAEELLGRRGSSLVPEAARTEG
jgi:LAO/AO transport system kinase